MRALSEKTTQLKLKFQGKLLHRKHKCSALFQLEEQHVL